MTIKIIGMHTHDSYQADFCSVPGIEMHHLTNEKHILWGAGSRPKPDNLFEVPFVELTDIDWSKYDIMLVQSPEQHMELQHVPLPKIHICHTLPYPLYQGGLYHEIKRDPWTRRIVFLTEEAVLAWRMPPLEVEVIMPMIDTAQYSLWEGGTKMALTVCNNLPQRNWCCGWDVWRYCTDGLPRLLVGEGNEAAGPDAAGFKDGGAVAGLMSQCAVYFNTNTNSAVGTSLLEAMAVGMPIVSVDKWVAHTYLVNSDTHFTPRSILASNVMPQLRRYLEDVLENPEKYRTMGAAARKTAQQIFSPEAFRENWGELLQEVANGK